MKNKVTVALMVVLAVGILAVSAVFLFGNNTERVATEKEITDEVERVVKEFMEEVYINRNYGQVSSLYIPPDGFETHLSAEPMSVEEYIEWLVGSVDLQSYDPAVTRVQIISVESIDDHEPLETEGDLYRVTFHFIKENGEAVHFGPCCGAGGDPSPDMFSRVLKTQEGYRIFKVLPYIP